MPDARTYPSGVPCWIDIEPAGPDAAREFYGSLFGWTFENAMPADAPGYYLIASLDGQDVAGIGMPTDDPASGWNTYVAVDDVVAVAAAVERLGGTVVAPPDEGGPGGQGASFLDPAGAPFRIWQPRRRPGAQLTNSPGSWNFSDLHTAAIDEAKEWYGSLFGWEADDLEFGGTLWRRPGYGEHLAATVNPDIHDRQAEIEVPPGFADAIAWLAPLAEHEQPHWHVTFAVADRDRSLELATGLGATLVGSVVDDEWTRSAIVRDPEGATFTLSQFDPH